MPSVSWVAPRRRGMEVSVHMYMQADGPTARTQGSARISSNSASSSLQPWPGLVCMCVAAGVREEKAGVGLGEIG